MEIEIVRLPVATGQMEAVRALVRQAARDGYLARPACLSADMAEHGEDAVIVIRWASADQHQAAAASTAGQAFFAALGPLAAGPPVLESHGPTVAGGRLAGRVALITGGAAGIGRAVVDAFVREGARVGIADRNADALAQARRDHGDKVQCIHADLSTLDGNRLAVRETVSAFGGLDVLVGNAALFDGFFDFAGVDGETLDAGFDTIFDVNVRGLILACREALPHLVAARGSIIVTLSNASYLPDGGGVMYVASKHAALGVMRQLAHELAPAVRVNGVAPGATRTGIAVPEVFGGPLDQTAPEISAMIRSLVPVGIHADAADHAEAYVLLAAAGESRAMTGTVIESDGGLGIRGVRRTRGGDALLAE